MKKTSKTGGQRIVQVSFRVPGDLATEIKITAAALGVSAQEYIRKAVEDHLDRDGAKVRAAVQRGRKSRAGKGE